MLKKDKISAEEPYFKNYSFSSPIPEVLMKTIMETLDQNGVISFRAEPGFTIDLDEPNIAIFLVDEVFVTELYPTRVLFRASAQNVDMTMVIRNAFWCSLLWTYMSAWEA